MDLELREAARRAVIAFIRWQQADGIFPAPEYDDAMDRMHELGVELDMDTVALAEEWRQHYDSLPR